MTSVKIRRARTSDAEVVRDLNADVQALHAAAHPHVFKTPVADEASLQAAREMIAQDDHVLFIAFVDKEAAGYAFASARLRAENHLRFANDAMYLHHLSVRPAFQRRGIGAMLINAVRDAGLELGIERMELDVWTFNRKAHEFFARQGFVDFNLRMWREADGAP